MLSRHFPPSSAAVLTNALLLQASQVYPTVMTHYQPWSKAPIVDDQMVRDQTLEILSDAQITAPVVQMANLHSNLNQKSYFYCFSHQSAFGDYLVVSGAHGPVAPLGSLHLDEGCAQKDGMSLVLLKLLSHFFMTSIVYSAFHLSLSPISFLLLF